MFKKLGSKLKEQKGFTLIELLAVIVILGIIAAIAIPAIGNVINKSETKATAQEGVQIINAAKMFIANEPSSALTWTAGTGGAAGTATAPINKTNLDKYLDRVSATTYEVIVTKNTTSGKVSYELTGGHPAVNLILNATTPANTDKVSEQDLVNKAK
jgi:type IV pilus assembly protein PilA